MTEAARIVKETTYAVTMPIPKSWRTFVPKVDNMTREMQNTPAFTTATACRRALTGVGATIAEGSQLCKGMIAALAKPATKRIYVTVTQILSEPAGNIPVWMLSAKSSVPVIT